MAHYYFLCFLYRVYYPKILLFKQRKTNFQTSKTNHRFLYSAKESYRNRPLGAKLQKYVSQKPTFYGSNNVGISEG